MSHSDSGELSKTKRKQLIWPDPLIIEPTETHISSAIILHGRGSNAERFGLEFLKAPTSNGQTLPVRFPGMKWIFPTAKKRRAVKFKKTPINQWFDNYSLDDPSQRPELQYDGLHETSVFVHGLIEREIESLGSAGRVVLGGLSQGCAAGLHVFLNWQPGSDGDGRPIAAFFGMSGWLPFADELDPRKTHDDESEDDLFGHSKDKEEEDLFEVSSASGDEYDEFARSHSHGKKDKELEISANDDDKGDLVPPETKVQLLQSTALHTARDIGSLPPLPSIATPIFPRTPVFLGHGMHDPKVSIKLGEQARDVFEALSVSVQWKAYDEGHWYKVPEQIDHVAEFVGKALGS